MMPKKINSHIGDSGDEIEKLMQANLSKTKMLFDLQNWLESVLSSAHIKYHAMILPQLNSEAENILSNFDLSLRNIPPTIANAIPKRKYDFAAGRICAICSLAKLGVRENKFLDRSASGIPIWPKKYVGSISHSEHFAVAVAAEIKKFSSLGIDIEERRFFIFDDNIETILNSKEMALCKSLSNHHELEMLYLLFFSAKESIFKCLFPHVSYIFEFQDVEIENLDLSGQAFKFKVLKHLSHTVQNGFQGCGRLFLSQGLVVTLCSLEPVDDFAEF